MPIDPALIRQLIAQMGGTGAPIMPGEGTGFGGAVRPPSPYGQMVGFGGAPRPGPGMPPVPMNGGTGFGGAVRTPMAVERYVGMGQGGFGGAVRNPLAVEARMGMQGGGFGGATRTPFALAASETMGPGGFGGATRVGGEALGAGTPYARAAIGPSAVRGALGPGVINAASTAVPGGVGGAAGQAAAQVGRYGSSVGPQMGGAVNSLLAPRIGGPVGTFLRSGSKVAKGVKGVGLGLGIGYAGNMVGDALGGSSTFQGRATKGAATGAAFGLLGGPWGAAAGGVLGGLYGGVFGKKTKKVGPVNYKLRLQDAINTMGLPPEVQAQLMRQYTARVKVFGNTKENKEATANAVAEAGLAAMETMAAQGQGQGAYGGAYDAENAANGYGPLAGANSAYGLKGQAALQMQAAQFMQPYSDQIRMDAANQAGYLSQAAASLPPAYRSVVEAGAIGNMTAANQMATAYQATAALAPATAAYQAQMQKFNAAGNALYGQALSNQLNPPAASAAGQVDLSSLISR